MGKISEFSVKKPITVLMSVLIIIILGVVSLTRLQTDLLPSINLPYAVVSTQYIGASPEEVELGVTKPLESQLATVSNIKNVQSISQEHASIIILEFNESTNMDSALIEMREKLDMIKGYLPDDVTNPMILKLNPDMMPIMNFSITLEGMDVNEATPIMEDYIVPRIERIEGIASVDVSGTAQKEVQITLKEAQVAALNAQIDAMNEQYGQSLPKAEELIKMMIQGQNLSMPTGYVTDEGYDYLVRVGDKLENIEELREMVVFGQFKLEDLATVEFGVINEDSYSKVNGEDAISFTIQKQNSFATTEVVAAIHDELEKIQEDYPNAEVVVLMDQAEYIDESVSSVTSNLIYGGILAVFILFLFLRNIKPTLVIALAIPISVMAAFILIYFSGITLNVISMGGLALGIGMLVDNSIVVIENIYRLRDEGASMKDAAVKGASQVTAAITASTLTTVAVFLPIVFLEGLTAQIFKEMALTITFSLVASLAIAITLVPTLASTMMSNVKPVTKETVLDKVKKVYTRVLKFSLNNKIITLLATLALFGGSIFLSLQVGTEFFPATEANQLSVSVNMPEGTEFEDTVSAVDEVVEQIMTIDDIEYVGARIGSGGGMGMLFGGGGSSSGSIDILLEEDADRTIAEVADDIRDLTKDMNYEIEIDEQGQDMGSFGGSGVQVVIKGQELDQLKAIAKEIGLLIEGVEGTTEVNNGLTETSRELKITVNKDVASQYNLTVGQVLQKVSSLLQDPQAFSQLSIDGREYDIKVMKTEEVTIEDIENIVFVPANPVTGQPAVLLKDIAEVDPNAQGLPTINRMNQSRTISVSAQVAEGYNIGKVGQEVTEAIESYDAPDGYIVEIQGENEQINSAMQDLMLALVLAIVLIYMIMASQFQSLLYPFIVMFTIPLAFTGGFLGLFITQTPISVVAFIGLIILAGIVVNNGIVLVDYINQLKAEGKSTYEAIIEAGNTRLRPIIMTALTTILALSTMALGIGEGAETMQPMAITAIGGLIYSTILTLVIVPVIYAGFERLKRVKVRDDE